MYVCIHVCVPVHIWMGVCLHVCSAEVSAGCLPQILFNLCFALNQKLTDPTIPGNMDLKVLLAYDSPALIL